MTAFEIQPVVYISKITPVSSGAAESSQISHAYDQKPKDPITETEITKTLLDGFVAQQEGSRGVWETGFIKVLRYSSDKLREIVSRWNGLRIGALSQVLQKEHTCHVTARHARLAYIASSKKS